MIDGAQKSDPDLNYAFSRDWGAGRFRINLADEAARWLEARRKMRTRASTAQSRYARMRAWRST